MMVVFRIYEKLSSEELLNNYAVKDVIKILHQVQIVKINSK
jgi:hypothetical protein